MMTRKEIKMHVSPFNCDGWIRHTIATKMRVVRQQAAAHARAVERKKNRPSRILYGSVYAANPEIPEQAKL